MNPAPSRRPKTRRPPAAQQWESFKDLIHELWVRRDLPLEDVRTQLAGHGHVASSRMYKARLADWGFGKYTSKQDWQAFVIVRHRARTAGFELNEVEIHSRIRNLSELGKYLRKRSISETDLFTEAMESGASVPDHVQWLAASINSKEQCAALKGLGNSVEHICGICADKVSISIRDVGMLLPAKGSPTYNGNESFESHRDQQHHAVPCESDSFLSKLQLREHHKLNPNEAVAKVAMYLEKAVNPELGIMPPFPSFSELSGMVAQTNSANAAQATHSYDYCGKSAGRESSNLHNPISPPLAQSHQQPDYIERTHDLNKNRHLSSHKTPFEPPGRSPAAECTIPTAGRYEQTEKNNSFMDDMFRACMSGAAGDVDFEGLWLGEATIKLNDMIAAQDPFLLVTTHQVLVWLQVHDASSRPESLIRALSRVTARALGKDSLIATVLEWMTAAAGKQLSKSRTNSEMLRQVADNFSETLGPEHPHTIVARYYVCFHMVRVDCRSRETKEKLLAEIEEVLESLYRITSKVLRPSHFLAVCILGTLSRVQSRQGKLHVALGTIERCLREAPLGLIHPHRLELMTRKAVICGHLKDKLKEEATNERQYWDKQMEEIYWTVVSGRLATLGRYHRDTERAHDTLVQILKENERWESMRGEVHELLTNSPVAVEEYENWWHRMVPRDREGDAPRSSSEEA